jgi:hypothetical protein
MPGLGHIIQRDSKGLYILIITFIFWIIINVTTNLWFGLIYIIYMIIIAYLAYNLPEV